MARRRFFIIQAILMAAFGGFAGCSSETAISQEASAGVVIKQPRMDELHEDLVAAMKAATAKVMTKPGIVGVQGGAHVKLLNSKLQEIRLPLPQLSDEQVPICFAVRSKPQACLIECQLKTQDSSNVTLLVRLKGDRNQEVLLDWTAAVLVSGTAPAKDNSNRDEFRKSSACVQSDSRVIQKLADELWPQNNELKKYAANIQRYVRDMKQKKPPRTLDAVGILDSGSNWICTANANLAVSLLRAKGIAARSVAVIPPIAQRLEMHRVVEYLENGVWVSFDPSSLNADIPLQPWQSIIMARTTISDENIGGKPRIGVSVGSPYGQEIELVTSGVTLAGQDFFWTIARPLAEFSPDAETFDQATTFWKRFLKTGELNPGQIKAHSAATSDELLNRLKSE